VTTPQIKKYMIFYSKCEMRLAHFLICDFTAFLYHRFLHWHSANAHIEHHKHPKDVRIMMRASAFSGAFAAFGLLTPLNRAPLMYWSLLSVVHPIWHIKDDVGWFSWHQRHHDNPNSHFGAFICWDVLFASTPGEKNNDTYISNAVKG
tara:strand:- start:1309 stop:1752 length:444 start_codon:yes stop_codon:yes gene_type:complete